MKDESSHSRIQEVALAEVKEGLSHPVSQNLDRQRCHGIGEWRVAHDPMGLDRERGHVIGEWGVTHDLMCLDHQQGHGIG